MKGLESIGCIGSRVVSAVEIKRSDLEAEFIVAVSGMERKNFDHLAQLGVRSSCVFGAPSLVGLVNLAVVENGLYQPGDHGELAYVIPLCDGQPSRQLGTIQDLLAFRPGQPDQWWLRYGIGVLLNPALPDWCTTLEPVPLQLFSDPLSWLRAGGQGCVICDWSAHLPTYLRGLQDIVCDTSELAARVHSKFEGYGPTPRIHVTQEACNVAAE